MGCIAPARRIGPTWSGGWATRGVLLAAVLVLVGLLLVPHGGSGVGPSRRPLAAGAAAMAPALSTAVAPWSLTVAANPGEICPVAVTGCTAGQTETRVLLSAAAPATAPSWPAVQVAFVIETTAYDGVYDPADPVNFEKNPGAGYDPCAAVTGQLCEESNGVPFFVANARAIVNGIQSENPHSSVSFAMVDYAGTGGGSMWWGSGLYDDGADQVAYHVDSAAFVSASAFPSVVQQFQSQVLNGGYIEPDEDLADSFLHSGSVSALYGTILGSGLQWANNTHHVIVWMGSTAPEDPAYPENYCASPSGMLLDDWPFCHGTTCQPSADFPVAISPNCEGWVHSQDGNSADSIAGLAHTAPTCTDSIGGACTIDTIDLWDTPTDPYSLGWPTGTTYRFPGPGSAPVLADSTNILMAGCDLAAATGGTWDGPTFWTCPGGQSGTLRYVAHGPPSTPNTGNPSLLAAFDGIGFGAIRSTEIGVGGDRPIFSFVPYGAFAMAPQPEYATSCVSPSGFAPHCPVAPTVSQVGGTWSYGWNWSAFPSENVLRSGDLWTAAFNVVATGPPYGNVPLDACVTPTCYGAGGGAVDGAYTWVQYRLPNSTSLETQSFPLAKVTVSIVGVPVGVTPPPPPAPPPAAVPVLAPVQVSLPQPIPLPIQSPLSTVSIQATSAGLLMAGITRVMMKNKPIAMQMAMKNGPAQSRFDKPDVSGPEAGRFE
jgi:hypothetical protein